MSDFDERALIKDDEEVEESGWSDSDDEEESSGWGSFDEDEEQEEESGWASDDEEDDADSSNWGSFDDEDSEEYVSDDEEESTSSWGYDEDSDEEEAPVTRYSSDPVSIKNILKSSFSLRNEFVNFEDITFMNPTKSYRSETYKGLTQSIAEMGILQPIHVAETAGYSEHLSDGGEPEKYSGQKFILIDGLRRIFGGTRNNMFGCNAIVWHFDNSDVGRESLISLSLILNKVQTHKWQEIWEMFQVLELNDISSPAEIEYLLQLESGDAMRLKDIMLSEYDEVKEALISNKKTLQQAYSMLNKLRKDEDKLQMEDTRGISITESGEAIADTQERVLLSNEEVKEILDMAGDSSDVQFSDDNFSEWSGEDVPYNWQDRREGDRIDENLRQSILERDRFTCQISGFGEGLPAHLTRKLLNVHHKVPVQFGGLDDPENLVTLSRDVHDLVHMIIAQNGKLGISKSTYDELSEETKNTYKGIMLLVNIALRAAEKAGAKTNNMAYEVQDKKAFWEDEE